MTPLRGDMPAKAFEAATVVLTRSYFAKYSMWRSQNESYEMFMESTLPVIIKSIPPIDVRSRTSRVEIQFKRVTILPAYQHESDGTVRPVLPSECRQRKLTYQNGVVVDVVQRNYVAVGPGEGGATTRSVEDPDVEWELVQEYEFLEVPLFQIPCMVRSKFCRLHDLPPDNVHDFIGGYFLINGQEKVLQAQIKLRTNSVHVFKAQGSERFFYAEVRSSNETKWKATSSLRVNIAPLQKDKSGCVSKATAFTRVTQGDDIQGPDIQGAGTHGAGGGASGACGVDDDAVVYRLNTHIPVMYITVPFATFHIPIATMCRMLGTPLTESMMHRAVRGVFSESSLDESGAIVGLLVARATDDPHHEKTRDELVAWFAEECAKEKSPSNYRSYVDRTLRFDILPHLGTDDAESSRRAKVLYIALMTARTILTHVQSTSVTSDHFGSLADDRDNWRFKKVDCAGSLIGILVRQLMRTFVGALRVAVSKQLDAGANVRALRVIDGFINSRKLETNIRYHFATGAWTVMRGAASGACTGVCNPLSRISPVAAISALNKINCPVNRDGKTSTPRLLHPSDWGNVCCVETPEGGGCGLVLNLCALTHVRQGYDQNHLAEWTNDALAGHADDVIFSCIENGGGPGVLETWIDGATPVFVNGSLYGTVRDRAVDAVTGSLRRARASGAIPFDVSIVHQTGTSISVNGDGGVCTRPVIVAGRIDDYIVYLRGLLEPGAEFACDAWGGAISDGLIEYIDTEEQAEHCVVAPTLEAFRTGSDRGRFTHVEVDVNLAIMGVTANLVPFADYNQSPRVIYQAAMGKQAVCSMTSGFDSRLDSNLYALHYPQRPLCRTNMETILSLDDFSSSTEAVLMIGSIDGFNQEDSILMNKSCVDRGFARITSYKTYFDEVNGRGNDEEVFCNVSNAAVMKSGKYDHLDDDGFARVGSRLIPGDVVIGKEAQSMELGPDGKHVPIRRDRSTIVKDPGVVDLVSRSISKDGKSQVRVRVRQERIPLEGDKFASRHAQKGTIGRLVSQEDLPFNREGMSPDIIINPHGMVSRMTIGNLIEALAGKACALAGCYCNATPFRDTDTGVFEDILHRHGYARDGREVFYDGRTGEKINRPLFMGIVTYQRLRHLVLDKINSRARGIKHALTHQPVDGRAKGGGLRVGEMERDCIVSHGASAVLHDRLLLNSDAKEVAMCRKCGLMAEPAHNHQFARGFRGAEPYCRGCNMNDAQMKTIPGACSLLEWEIMATGCAMRNF
jgi:DNA-directed RNA polymerase II subunit RPB2